MSFHREAIDRTSTGLRAGLAVLLAVGSAAQVFGAEGGPDELAPLVVAVAPFQVKVLAGSRPDVGLPTARALEDGLQAYLSEIESITLLERTLIHAQRVGDFHKKTSAP